MPNTTSDTYIPYGSPADLWGLTLTAREKEIARLAAQGKRTREIADELAVSPQTVDSHFKHIFNKLQIHSRVELTNVVRECAD